MSGGVAAGDRRRGLTFRLYRPEDREAVFRLWADFIAPGRMAARREIFDWLAGHNPALEGRSPYHLVLDGEEVVAVYGRMPVRFLVRGEERHGYVCHDIYVHRRYRGKDGGVSEELVRELAREADSFVLALWFAPFNYALHRRCGWRDIPSCGGWVKVYDPGPFLAGRVGPAWARPLAALAARGLLRLQDATCPRRARAGIEVKELSGFDERFDGLAAELGREFTVIARRDRRYLEWKYGARPHMRYRILAALAGDRLAGYLVFRVDRSGDAAKGLLIDFLAPARRPEVLVSLVAEALRRLEREPVAYVTAFTTQPAFDRVLRRCGFWRSGRRKPIMIARWEEAFPAGEVERLEDWYLTRGDGDGDFWTTA